MVARNLFKGNLKLRVFNQTVGFTNRDFLNRNTVTFAFSFLLFWYLQSYGTFSLRNQSDTGRSQYFFAQAESMLRLEWSVDPRFLEGWNGECLQYGGVCTGYYGIFPSLIRLPVAILFDGSHQLGSLFLLIAYAVFLFGSLFLLKNLSLLLVKQELSLIPFLGFASCMAFSPVTFLAIRGYMYEEAILWGVGLLILTVSFLIKFKLTESASWIWLAIFSATACLHSRVVEGVSAIVIVASVIVFENKDSLSKALLRFGSVSFSGMTLILLNLSKFGVISPSMKFHGGYLSNPDRLDLVQQCGDMNFNRIPHQLILYLFPKFDYWNLNPTYSPGDYKLNFFGIQIYNSCIESTEYFSPINKVFPLVFLLSIMGFFALLINFRQKFLWIITLGLGLNMLILCSAIGMTQRYLADLFPFFFFLAALGLIHLQFNLKLSISFILVAFIILFQATVFYGSTVGFWNLWPDRPQQYLELPFANDKSS